MSTTLKNLESALAGESMAHIKYRDFARIAREEGHEDIAQHFEHTADQELKHAWGHLELLIGGLLIWSGISASLSPFVLMWNRWSLTLQHFHPTSTG